MIDALGEMHPPLATVGAPGPNRPTLTGSRAGTGGGVTLLRWLVAALLALSVLPQGVAGQEERVTVRLDGRAVFRVGPSSDADAATRARRIEGRLHLLLDNPSAIVPATVEETGTDSGERIIAVAGVTVVTVSAADAEENLLTVDQLAAQWASAIDDALVRARDSRLSAWGRFSSEVSGTVRGAFGRLVESAIVVVPRVIAAVLLIGLFWLIATGLRWLLRITFRRFIDDLTIENLIKQVAYYSVWLLGILLAADALGFEPAAVATGLGLGSLVLGFALKDVLSNFVSGLLILLTRPFRIRDQIVIGETEGTVERILLRATQIRTYDGRQVLVPNAEVFTSRVTNNTASPIRRGSALFYVGYDADLQRAASAAREGAASASGVLVEPAASVLLSELGPEAVSLEVQFWTDSRRSDFVATRAAVRKSVVEHLRAAGVGLPDPDRRTVRLERH